MIDADVVTLSRKPHSISLLFLDRFQNDKEGPIESGIRPAQQPKFSLIFSLIALV